MDKIKPLDQNSLIGSQQPIKSQNYITKLQNLFITEYNIMERLMKFALSVPDFRRSDKGNIRHRLADMIMLMILARSSECVARADIIELGRQNLCKPRKLGLLMNHRTDIGNGGLSGEKPW